MDSMFNPIFDNWQLITDCCLFAVLLDQLGD